MSKLKHVIAALQRQAVIHGEDANCFIKDNKFVIEFHVPPMLEEVDIALAAADTNQKGSDHEEAKEDRTGEPEDPSPREA